VELVVVDESHNFRNPMSNRWENLFTLLNEHMKGPKVLFLTATPINNTVWDLYWQIMLLVKNNESAFIRENVPDLSKFFKMAESNPTLLNDLLNEISIRRTKRLHNQKLSRCVHHRSVRGEREDNISQKGARERQL